MRSSRGKAPLRMTALCVYGELYFQERKNNKIFAASKSKVINEDKSSLLIPFFSLFFFGNKKLLLKL